MGIRRITCVAFYIVLISIFNHGYAHTVDHTILWDVSSVTAESYKETIAKFRDRVKELTLPHYNIPVLPSFVKDRWIDLKLNNGEVGNITLKIQHSNLYIQGYQMQNRQFVEFQKKKSEKEYFPRSYKLPCKENYNNMEKVAKKGIQEMRCDLKRLKTAVSLLSYSNNDTVRVQSLMTLALMISEATRFLNICDNFATLYGEKKLTAAMDTDLVRKWSTLSKWVQMPTEGKKNLPKTINGRLVEKLEDLSQVLGIMKKETNNNYPKNVKGKWVRKVEDLGEVLGTMYA